MSDKIEVKGIRAQISDDASKSTVGVTEIKKAPRTESTASRVAHTVTGVISEEAAVAAAAGISEEELRGGCGCHAPEPNSHKLSIIQIIVKGLWKDNPALCQLLGMCPLLAVTTSAANALGLGIATLAVLVMSSTVISLIRKVIVPEVRIPLYVVIIAALVTVVRFEVEAHFPELYQQLGIYLALIATNCVIMGRAEAFAGKNSVFRSFVDAFSSALGFTIVLFALGSIREIIGNGTFLVGASDLLGPWAKDLEVHLFSVDFTFLIGVLPPGGFFVLAFLIAGKNALEGRAKRKAERKARIRSLNI